MEDLLVELGFEEEVVVLPPTGPASFPVNGQQLKLIFPNTPQARCDEVAALLNKYSDEYGLTSPERMAHFIGQIGAESNLNSLKEGYCYQKGRIKEIFGKVKHCDQFVGYTSDLSKCNGNKPSPCTPPLTKIISDLVVKDEYLCSLKLFDLTYSCRLGNGPASTGDGGRFRGRAFLHLTGKGKYIALQEYWNSTYSDDSRDFLCSSSICEGNRDLLVSNLDFAMKSSLAFWSSVDANTKANTVTDESIKAVSKAINGGDIGLPTRIT